MSEDRFVERRYDETSEWAESGENVARTRRVFAAVESRAELTDRLEEIDVVAADEILSETDDCAHETRLRERDTSSYINGSLRGLPRRDDRRRARPPNRPTEPLSLLACPSS